MLSHPVNTCILGSAFHTFYQVTVQWLFRLDTWAHLLFLRLNLQARAAKFVLRERYHNAVMSIGWHMAGINYHPCVSFVLVNTNPLSPAVRHSISYYFVYVQHGVLYRRLLSSGPTSNKPASEGCLHIGQPLVMCHVVCPGSPHWQVPLSANLNVFTDDLHRPVPVCGYFSMINCCPWTYVPPLRPIQGPIRGYGLGWMRKCSVRSSWTPQSKPLWICSHWWYESFLVVRSHRKADGTDVILLGRTSLCQGCVAVLGTLLGWGRRHMLSVGDLSGHCLLGLVAKTGLVGDTPILSIRSFWWGPKPSWRVGKDSASDRGTVFSCTEDKAWFEIRSVLM